MPGATPAGATPRNVESRGETGSGGKTRSSFILPFREGQPRKLIQGNNGPWGHTGHAAHAFDFLMPIGTHVIAAAGGVVVRTEERFGDGTRKPGEENYVIIGHDDGSFGRYYHLTKGGALVSVGDRVAQGGVIALSGNSGASAGAHLHFDVTTGCPDWGCQTIPITFLNARDAIPKQGELYEALAMTSRGIRGEARASRAARAWRGDRGPGRQTRARARRGL